MASNNFMSALMMKNPNVKHAHIEMALQEEKMQSFYDKFLQLYTREFVPKVSENTQLMTLQKFHHVINE